MQSNLTELVFILDRSGSMGGLESDTIGGFNALLKKQKKVPGEALITTVLFDDQYELLHDRINLRGVDLITSQDYYVRGSTALLDAVGKTILKIANAHQHTAEAERPESVMVVITTDDYSKVKQLVEKHKSLGWEFIFLGANIDAAETAEQFGIDKSRASNYHADSKGTELNFQVMNEAVQKLRIYKSIEKNWKSEIEKDYKERGGK